MLEKIKWYIRELKKIAENYQKDKNVLSSRIEHAHARIGRHTTVSADIHFRDKPHQIIVTGKYRNRDYVRVFNVDVQDFETLVGYLLEQEPKARRGAFDMPHHIQFEAVMPHDKW